MKNTNTEKDDSSYYIIDDNWTKNDNLWRIESKLT
jgi:hypothetical protein